MLDEPRPGRPRSVTDAQVDEVITKTLESTPKNATHWSTRSMAVEVGLTQSAVHRIWKAFGLQPHRQETWKLSKDPQFIDKVRDVVGPCLDPPERAVVLCVDEGSGPNGANPHHELSERVIQAGDMVVLDFGGLKDGYGSDTTRSRPRRRAHRRGTRGLRDRPARATGRI